MSPSPLKLARRRKAANARILLHLVPSMNQASPLPQPPPVPSLPVLCILAAAFAFSPRYLYQGELCFPSALLQQYFLPWDYHHASWRSLGVLYCRSCCCALRGHPSPFPRSPQHPTSPSRPSFRFANPSITPCDPSPVFDRLGTLSLRCGLAFAAFQGNRRLLVSFMKDFRPRRTAGRASRANTEPHSLKQADKPTESI